jgi:hypothetical protein
MQVDVVNSVLINRPVAVVSQYAADPDNAPLWYENIKSVEWRTPGPVKVGSQVDFVAQFLGRRLAYTYEVVEFVPGRCLTMRTPGPPFPMETTYTWENQNGATRMTLRNRGTPSGFSVWLAPLMSLMIGGPTGRTCRYSSDALKRALRDRRLGEIRTATEERLKSRSPAGESKVLRLGGPSSFQAERGDP